MDAAFYVPVGLFSAFNPDDYVYLYAQFGKLQGAGYKSQAGFEEYIIRKEVEPVPEPVTMLLFGTGLVGLAGLRRKKS